MPTDDNTPRFTLTPTDWQVISADVGADVTSWDDLAALPTLTRYRATDAAIAIADARAADGVRCTPSAVDTLAGLRLDGRDTARALPVDYASLREGVTLTTVSGPRPSTRARDGVERARRRARLSAAGRRAVAYVRAGHIRRDYGGTIIAASLGEHLGIDAARASRVWEAVCGAVVDQLSDADADLIAGLHTLAPRRRAPRPAVREDAPVHTRYMTCAQAARFWARVWAHRARVERARAARTRVLTPTRGWDVTGPVDGPARTSGRRPSPASEVATRMRGAGAAALRRRRARG